MYMTVKYNMCKIMFRILGTMFELGIRRTSVPFGSRKKQLHPGLITLCILSCLPTSDSRSLICDLVIILWLLCV